MSSPTPSPPATIGLAGLTRPDGQDGQHPRVDAPPAPVVVAEPTPFVTSIEPTRHRDATGHDSIPRAADARHAVSFTGSGSEYFRIWIVNLLLTLVTVGIYYPWAKVRKLRYFYGNTIVAGHPFDFHGDPLKMLRGYAIVGALFISYSVASQLSPTAGGFALLVLAAIWPALLYAGQRFRLSQTSWRGLRFGFHGTLGGAYKAFWPLLLPLALAVPLIWQAGAGGAGPSAGGVIALAVGMVLIAYAVIPLVWWSLKRWQHNGLGLGNVHTRFTAGPGSFYAVWLKTILVTMAAASVFGAFAAVVYGIGDPIAGLMRASGQSGLRTLMYVVLAVMLLLGYAAVLWVSKPYFTSRMQNLVWNRTESPSIGFDSRLRFRPLLWLSMKNWLLIIATLGLYWPFAAIATAKMKLEAVEVIAHRDLDALVRDERAMSKDAAGDAAGDVFGIDIGM